MTGQKIIELEMEAGEEIVLKAQANSER